MRETWFITGASSGFGLAFARHALAQGHQVVAAARNPAALDGLVAEAPERVLAVALDVTQAAQAEAAVGATLARFGRIDVLVNNAGYGSVGAIEETPDAELRAQLETNFFGAIAVTRAVLPAMRAQRSGAIVMMSSMGGQMSFGGFGAYSASKFALEGASEALAQEMAPFGVKVIIVEPGAFRTGFAGGSALRHMPVLEPYREALAPIRGFARGMDGTQQGDPAKAAAAVAQALRAERTPLRLVLGADAVEAVRGHAETLLAEIAAWEAVSRATAVADQT
ncbi:oxidoreductase [Falsiroseomonas sp. HW251]|uniref:oxidoreductase n=1 Tax=Falsiroseomonas sp. HW251 TaxID=3390998 RepID=UPI003D3195EB